MLGEALFGPFRRLGVKGGFTLGNGSNIEILGPLKHPCLQLDSRLYQSLKRSFSNWKDYFTKWGPPRFDGNVMPHSQNFIFSYVGY